MSRRNQFDINGMLNAFTSTYGLAKAVRRDYQDKQVQDQIKTGMDQAQTEADASGKPIYTLDQGQGDPNVPDYQAADKSNIDMIAQQENDIRALQAQPTSAGLSTLSPQTPQASQAPAPTSALAQLAQGAQAQSSQAPAAPATPAAAPTEPAYTRGQIDTPKVSAMDVFTKKYAPSVIKTLMSQGREADARAFEDWTRSEKGAAYGESWLKAVQMEHAGDTDGGMKAIQDLYNKELPDGQYATAIKGDNGQYTIQVRDEKTNAVLHNVAGNGHDLLQTGLGMLAPDKAFSFLAGQQAATAKRAQEVSDTNAKYQHETNLKAMELAAKEGPNSPLGKMIADRDKLPAGSPDRARYDQAIQKYVTTGGGSQVQINVSPTPQVLPDGSTGLIQTDKSGNARVIPMPGLASKADQAYNALKGVNLQKVEGASVPMYFRNGQRVGFKEAQQINNYVDTLRKFGRRPPWEEQASK